MSPTELTLAAALLCVVMPVGAQTTMEVSEDMNEEIKDAVNSQVTVSEAIQRSLGEIMKRVDSPEWKGEQARLIEEIQDLTGKRPAAGEEDSRESLVTRDRVIVFVSSSMPLATLHNYAADLERVNGLMVFRGMVGGLKTVAPTLELIANILRVKPSCTGAKCVMRKTNVVIDPILFRENAITRVPAAVFVENMVLQPYCERFTASDVPTNARHVVYGDLSLKGLLSELKRMSENSRVDALMRLL